MAFRAKFALAKKEIKEKGFFKCVKETIILSHHEPHEIAAGFAAGMVVSFFPTFSIGMFLALFLAWKRKWNFLATYLGTWFMNPLTASFWYFVEYKIGTKIIGKGVGFVDNVSNFNFWPLAKQIYLGAFVLAIIAGPTMYFLVYGASAKYRELKRKGKIPQHVILKED